MSMTPVNAFRAAKPSQQVGWIVGAVIAAATASLLLYLVINGPAIWAAAERIKAEAIEQENRAFCHKFGMGPETSAYARCANDLTQIRRQHEERIYQDMVGIL